MALTELIEEMERQILKEREKESREKVEDYGGTAENSGREAEGVS